MHLTLTYTLTSLLCYSYLISLILFLLLVFLYESKVVMLLHKKMPHSQESIVGGNPFHVSFSLLWHSEW